MPQIKWENVFGAWFVVIAIVIILATTCCAPLVIAGGVELEHDAWCHDHKDDPNCKGW